MKKLSLLASGMLMAIASSAFAGPLVQGVTESTDPAAIAAVEQQANMLRPSTMPMEHAIHHSAKHHIVHRAHHKMLHHAAAQPVADTMSK